MSKDNVRVLYTAFICATLIGVILWFFFLATRDVEPEQKQREISVILYDAGNGGWQSLEEGIRQAEDDFAVNINLVTMREGADGDEQTAMIHREIENGAEGILLAVWDYQAIYDALSEKEFKVPVITVESGLKETFFPLISADNYAMGNSLGEEILKDLRGKEEPVVAIVQDGAKRDSVEQRYQGLFDALEGKAKVLSVKEGEQPAGVDAFAALHKEALLKLSEQEKSEVNRARVYGIGNTALIVEALEQGEITKLVFQNEFNMGYLGIEMLLQELEGKKQKESREIDYFCVSREEIYGTQYEQLLFPIVE